MSMLKWWFHLSGDFRKIQKKSQIMWMLALQCEQQAYVDLLLTVWKSIRFIHLVVCSFWFLKSLKLLELRC